MTRGQSIAVLLIGVVALAAFIQGVNIQRRLNGSAFISSNKPVLM